MSSRTVSSMTEDELATLIRQTMRHELSVAGLRVDEPEDQDEAREDFRFVRRLRKAFEGASSKIGGALILAAIGGLLWVLGLGAKAAFIPWFGK